MLQVFVAQIHYICIYEAFSNKMANEMNDEFNHLLQ